MGHKIYGEHLYIIGDEHGRIKIGSANNVQKRLRQLQTGNPDRLRIIAEFEESGFQETFIQKLREENRIREDGELFQIDENSLNNLIDLMIKRSIQANRKYSINR